MKVMLGRDVTRDSVIITRDLAVIRNHTGDISQHHKKGTETVKRAVKQRKKLRSGGSKSTGYRE